MNIRRLNSPNHNVGRGGRIPDMDVLHTTGNTTQSAINTVNNRANSVSYAFIIAGASFEGRGGVPAYEDGDIFQMVDIENTAWHAGISAAVRNDARFRSNAHPTVQSRSHNPNQYTIGIGFGDMNLNGWRLTERQIASYIWLANHLRAERQRIYGFTMPFDRDHIIGHNQVNPVNRPNCPGNIQWGIIMDGLANAQSVSPGTLATPPAVATAPSSVTVRSGDTLGRIAQQHGTTVAELARINNIPNPNLIRAGQVIQLPSVPTPPPSPPSVPEQTEEEVTVDNAISAGIITDRAHWLGVLTGNIAPVPRNIMRVMNNALAAIDNV
ncbi:MAG: LysM peptidoglycan-binding domain-containing protein, partial [Defluviitaleaceae bacterium]|nr:LysM peptidoglycan-binding domain-containing protein [Defluviitaleaceae bacterium]